MIHRATGEEELLGDLGVAVARGDQFEHLALARRQAAGFSRVAFRGPRVTP